MRPFLFVPLIAACFASNTLATSTSESIATSFLQQVEAAIEDPIPPVSRVVPGYSPVGVSASSVVIADFETKGDTQYFWGMLVGQLLRWELLYNHKTTLRVPDFTTYYGDASAPQIPMQDIGRSTASAALVAKRLGISHLLTGTVSVAKQKFYLDVSLREAESGATIEAYRITGPLNEFPQSLNTVLQRTKTALGSPGTAGDGIAYSTETLAKLAEAFTEDRAERKSRMQRLWNEGLATPLTAAHHLWHLDVGNDLNDYFDRIEQVRAMFPGERGIEFTVARYIGYRDNPKLYETKVARLKKIVANSPHDPTPMLVLCDTLAENGYTLEAIALSRELLKRYPENYRVWWSVGASLMNHAWLLRGTSYWEDVPAKGKRQFPELKKLGARAIDKALAFNDNNSRLWSAKMWAIGHSSPEFTAAFEKAIRLDPTNRYAYEMAVNYSLPQWGGSFDAQDNVLALARKNIVDKTWHTYIERKYVGERTFWYKVRRAILPVAANLLQPLHAIVIALLLIAAAVALLLRARKRATEK